MSLQTRCHLFQQLVLQLKNSPHRSPGVHSAYSVVTTQSVWPRVPATAKGKISTTSSLSSWSGNQQQQQQQSTRSSKSQSTQTKKYKQTGENSIFSISNHPHFESSGGKLQLQQQHHKSQQRLSKNVSIDLTQMEYHLMKKTLRHCDYVNSSSNTGKHFQFLSPSSNKQQQQQQHQQYRSFSTKSAKSEYCQRLLSHYDYCNTNNRISGALQQQLQQQSRNLKTDSAHKEYRLEPPTSICLENFQAREIYNEAVNAVEPRYMVEKVLQFDPQRKIVTVKDRSYEVGRNVYVVGFGKAVLGMARTVEDMLGDHVVGGILSIPRGQRDVLREKDKSDLLLREDSPIIVYEGGKGYLPDHVSMRAAEHIETLLTKCTENDLVIVLISGGGSALLSLPQEGISLDDLSDMTSLMYQKGASVSDVNTLRKYLERLKGGKAMDAAYPAKVVSLIISDVVGDSVSLIASGPTIHDQVTAHQCLDIVGRLGLRDQIPPAIAAHLHTRLADEQSRVRIQNGRHGGGGVGGGLGVGGVVDTGSLRLAQEELAQNVLVGSNLMACQAAAKKARSLGHVPYILSTHVKGEARKVGATLATLGTFMLLCFDRRQLDHLSLLMLELDSIRSGITKQQVNDIITLVDTAVNTGQHATIISGGETVVNIKNTAGVGGRNLELALGASIRLQELFGHTQVRPHPCITILSADTDGEDGSCPAAGAVVTENFELEVQQEGLSSRAFLERNDSFGVLSAVKGGSSLLVTKMTATNVMDIQVMVVRNPLV